MSDNDLFFTVSLSLVKNLRSNEAREILTQFGNAENFFQNVKAWCSEVNARMALKKSLISNEHFILAEEEILLCRKRNWSIITINDPEYPFRLKECCDSPLVLYFNGSHDLNLQRIVSIVGTRKPSREGFRLCRELVETLSLENVTIISGMAEGIDTCAHKTSVENNLKTFGVVAHSLKRLYPYENKELAEQMRENGGLITEYFSESNFLPINFPARNRIIAGLCDATVVVESGIKGGSMITASIANSYDRDIFAFPGSPLKETSDGCNWMIRENRAELIRNGEDLLKSMEWLSKSIKNKQLQIFPNLSEKERQVLAIISKSDKENVDVISGHTGLKINRLLAILLELELKNLIQSLPGNFYCLK